MMASFAKFQFKFEMRAPILKHIVTVCLLFHCIDGCMSTTRQQKNVYGDALTVCSVDPLTGWMRDGFCRTADNDHGVHTVCAHMTQQFLSYTKAMGNDLTTAHLPHFPGLRPGDRWCLCVSRWKQALSAGVAPHVVMTATHEKALRVATLSELTSMSTTNVNNVTLSPLSNNNII